MIQKIIFKYSRIYDEHWREVYKRKNSDYPSPAEIFSYLRKNEKLWNKNQEKILKELSKITNLKWKSKFIYCYIVGKCIPFSDPLTLPVYKEYPNYFIDVLIHELIHQLFDQNEDLEKFKKARNYINRKYRKETHKTKIHILVHSVHTHIYLKFFDEARLKRDIELISRLPDYKRSWEIVQKEKYQNIINKFI